MESELNKIISFFKALTFNEARHIYHVGDHRVKESVSKKLKVFVPKADFEGIAISIDKRDKLPPGTTAHLWKLNSDVALAIGNRAHYFGELYAFNRDLIPPTGYEEAVVKFWNDIPNHIVPVIMELKMYHKEYMFAGTGDILLYNMQTGKYIIGDYKTNKDLYKNFNGQKLKAPFDSLLDMPLNHYQLQLSYYQLLFEQTGFEVESRKVIWLKPSGEYEMFDTEDYTEILKEHLKHLKQ
jgi:hypothetical protein